MERELGTLTPSQDKILNRASVDSSISFYDLWKPFIILEECAWTQEERSASKQNLIDAPEESDVIAWKKPGYQVIRQEKSKWNSSVDAQVGSGDIINWHKSIITPRGLSQSKPSRKRITARHHQTKQQGAESQQHEIDELGIQKRKRFETRSKITYGSQGVENLMVWESNKLPQKIEQN